MEHGYLHVVGHELDTEARHALLPSQGDPVVGLEELSVEASPEVAASRELLARLPPLEPQLGVCRELSQPPVRRGR